ncbi:hypothetical protein ACWGDE_37990 [Streptomyces sp. NPDC054956]
MMFGYADDWTVVLTLLLVLWWLCGPFVMAGLGTWVGRAGGRAGTKARVASVVVPVVVMAAPTIAKFKPDGVTPTRGDTIGFLVVEVGLLTILPWLIAYGVARYFAARRKRRG